jgi:flagellar motor switch protein FliN/FliY
MVADILSQDEIDKLLNVSSFDSGAPSADELSDDRLAKVTSLVSQFFVTANSTLGMLIAREASANGGEGEMISASDIDTEASVLLRASFRSGFTGDVLFYLPVGSATSISDLILGGEGDKKDALDESDEDAVKEAFGQILGNAGPAITGATGVEVGFDAITIETVDQGSLASAIDNGDNVYACKGSLKIDDILDTPLFVLFTEATTKSIANTLSPPEAAPAPAPAAPAAAPAQAAPAAQGAAMPQRSPDEIRNIDLIMDIEVEVIVRLGNADMPLREIQKLRPGSIIDLDKDTEALVELVVNDRVIARGELVVVSSDHFALRVTEIQSPTERIRSLGST